MKNTNNKQRRFRFAAIGLAIVMVLATAAVATAADQNGKANNRAQQGRGPGGPPGAGLPPGMTNAEVHVYKDGKTTTLQLDQGKVKSVTSDSVTITERDGQDVTIPTDSNTKVLAGPGKNASLSDLKEGQAVRVDREQGQAAKVICVLPKPGQRPPAPAQGSGAGQGAPQPGPQGGQGSGN